MTTNATTIHFEQNHSNMTHALLLSISYVSCGPTAHHWRNEQTTLIVVRCVCLSYSAWLGNRFKLCVSFNKHYIQGSNELRNASWQALATIILFLASQVPNTSGTNKFMVVTTSPELIDSSLALRLQRTMQLLLATIK